MDQLGRIPADGEQPEVTYENVTFRVMQVEDRRIDRVHAEVTPLPEEPEEGKERPDKKAEKENGRPQKRPMQRPTGSKTTRKQGPMCRWKAVSRGFLFAVPLSSEGGHQAFPRQNRAQAKRIKKRRRSLSGATPFFD